VPEVRVRVHEAGTIVRPAMSMTRAPAGTATVPRAPTAMMRLSRTTMSASSITSCRAW
jgi:hypothetical protein